MVDLLNMDITNKDCDFERIGRLQQKMYHRKATICAQRAEIFTRCFKETENEPIILRKSKAFKAVLLEMDIYIENDSLIVGNQACRNFAAPIFPEYSFDWVIEELDDFSSRTGDAFYVDEDTKNRLRKLQGYWKGKTHQDEVLANLPELNKEAEKQKILHRGGISMSGDGHIVPDHEYVLKVGFVGIKNEAEQYLKKDGLKQSQIDFYHGVIIAMEGAIGYCERFSELCKLSASNEVNERRKNELEDLAQVFKNLSIGKANNFHEAAQLVYLVHLLMMIESNGHSFSYGRFDQYMYTYYCTDIDNGTISKEKALEIITHFFIMNNSLNKIRPWGHTQYSGGYPLYSNLMVGGCDNDGKDASNEISYLCMEAMGLTGLPDPNFSLRFNEHTPHELMKTASKLIRKGFGMPSIFADDVCIPAMQSLGLDLETARDYCSIGCVEIGIPGKWGHRATGMTYVNLGKLVELLMHNGQDPKSGVQLLKLNGSEGAKITYGTYEELFSAWEKLLAFYSELAVQCDYVCDKSLKYYDVDPFASSTIDCCLERGMTLKEGGCKYDFVSSSNIGPSVVADSLAAVKKLVFDDKLLTLDELQYALDTNFNGLDGIRIRTMCKNAPKFGNDDDYVDKIAVDVYESYLKLLPNFKTERDGKGPFGCRYTMSTSNITSYVPNGFAVGATPDGRGATKPLNEGASPCLGADKKGPTAIINSMSKLPNHKIAGGQLLNMRFSPSALATEENLETFTRFVETGRLKNIFHNQFNIIDSETLKKAKAHPEDYPDLMVRVAGYCALFSTLMPEAQDAIIERTELNW